MKNLVKLALAFTLGIVVTVTVILPTFKATPEPAEAAPTPDVQAELKELINAAVMEALSSPTADAEPAAVQLEQEEKPEPVEEAEQEAEAPPEPEPTPNPTPAPTVQPTPIPKPKAPEPEYFYEDGNKYAIINGHKTYIAGDDEPATQSETYDWENDPMKDIPGGFN